MFNERHDDPFNRCLNVRQGHALAEVFMIGVKDIDLGPGEIIIREGKGYKDRHTALSPSEKGIGASLSAKCDESGLVAGRCKEWETLSTRITAQGPHAEIDTLT